MSMFNRLQDILRSYLYPADELMFGRDFEEAWEELNEFLQQPEGSELHRSPYRDSLHNQADSLKGFYTYSHQYTRPKPDPAEHLRQDYANLEVPFKSDLEQVKKSYKNLLRKYHPDQYARDAAKYKTATEITKKLNGSFQRIKNFHEGKR